MARTSLFLGQAGPEILCNVCGQKFSSGAELSEHIALAHPQSDPNWLWKSIIAGGSNVIGNAITALFMKKQANPAMSAYYDRQISFLKQKLAEGSKTNKLVFIAGGAVLLILGLKVFKVI